MEDEKFVQICGKSLLWHADSSKSSDYLPLSYQSHFQFHLDHILSSYPILTTKLQYLICSLPPYHIDHHISFQIHYPVAPFPRSTPTIYSNYLIYFSFLSNWLSSILWHPLQGPHQPQTLLSRFLIASLRHVLHFFTSNWLYLTSIQWCPFQGPQIFSAYTNFPRPLPIRNLSQHQGYPQNFFPSSLTHEMDAIHCYILL